MYTNHNGILNHVERLLRRKQNSSILRTYGKSQSPLIFNLARNIKLAGERTTSRGPKAESCPFIASCSREVEAVCVSHTDSGEGMLSLGRKAYLSLGEMSRSDREGIININKTLSKNFRLSQKLKPKFYPLPGRGSKRRCVC